MGFVQMRRDVAVAGVWFGAYRHALKQQWLALHGVQSDISHCHCCIFKTQTHID